MVLRKRALALTVVGAVSLAGCGGSSGGSHSASGVRQTLHDLANDLLSGNTSAACSLYSSSAIKEIFRGKSNCEKLLGATTLSSAEKSRLRKEAAKIDSLPVSIHGNTATVSNPTGTGSTTMTYENGRWLLDAPSGSSSSSTSTTAGP
jgi:hypothetical protein